MDNQLSIDSTDLSSAPFRQWNKNIGNVIVVVGFDSIKKNIDKVETIEIPDDCQHQFFRLNCTPFFLGTFSSGGRQINS
jgi:hypothetical protein